MYSAVDGPGGPILGGTDYRVREHREPCNFRSKPASALHANHYTMSPQIPLQLHVLLP